MLFSPPPYPNAMHVPDGFLSVWVSLVFWLVSILVLVIAFRKTNQSLAERSLPLMGVLAAAIFAGQMLNFSVTGGTSGHLLGAALATILLGPWAAIVVMTTVVSVQALLFQDGGMLALGANIFNMAIVGVFVSYFVFTLVSKIFKSVRVKIMNAGFAAAWSSIFIASLACALQLALSGTSPANIAIPAMAAIHALIGIGEGLITAGALAFVLAARPDLLQATRSGPVSNKVVVGVGALISLVLVFLSPLASSHPDGLEWVAEQKGFLHLALDPIIRLIPDYEVSGIDNPAVATIAAGMIGIVIVFVVAYLAGHSAKRSTTSKQILP